MKARLMQLIVLRRCISKLPLQTETSVLVFARLVSLMAIQIGSAGIASHVAAQDMLIPTVSLTAL